MLFIFILFLAGNSYSSKLISFILLNLIPWPGPTIFKIRCSRDNSRIVRQLIQNKWITTLEKYQVEMPIQCPFHPTRDIFFPQEFAKQRNRPSQWTCVFCGKSFYQEKYLDMHFDNRHKSEVNMDDDAVCLADYCDIMRCEVMERQIVKQDSFSGNEFAQYKRSKSTPITDLEIWREPTKRTALLVISDPGKRPAASSNTRHSEKNKELCDKSDAPKTEKQKRNLSDSEDDKCETILESSHPPKQQSMELQKLKANCKPEDLLKLKQKCEDLIRECIEDLLINLSVQDFKDIEDELNNGICWYLTCDRYWEDTQSNAKYFSRRIILVFVVLLTVGFAISYYIIWICFNDGSSGRGYSKHCYLKQYSDEFFPASDKSPSNENYIYITYPPEIKRKLLDSCYNRTTRL